MAFYGRNVGETATLNVRNFYKDLFWYTCINEDASSPLERPPCVTLVA
jgi:hypothetical protein